jgi:hypothetical protein
MREADMNFLKKLFGGNAASGERGLYFYVKPQGCEEVVRVRIDMNNDPSLADDNSTYFVRKTVRGTTYKCTRSAELYLTFDSGRKLQKTEVTGGALVSQTDYDAWTAAQENANP